MTPLQSVVDSDSDSRSFPVAVYVFPYPTVVKVVQDRANASLYFDIGLAPNSWPLTMIHSGCAVPAARYRAANNKQIATKMAKKLRNTAKKEE